MGKVIKYEEELERLRRQRKRQEEEEEERLRQEEEKRIEEGLRNAIKERPDLDQTIREALSGAVYDVAKYLKDVPQDRIPEALERLKKHADGLLLKASRGLVDYVDERIKAPGLDKSEDEKEKAAYVVKEEVKKRVGGFAKIYRKAFEDAREGAQKALNVQVPNEALPIVVVLAMVRAFGAVVELLASSGSFGVALAALGLDKYYKAKLSKALEVAGEQTGKQVDEETKEQLYKLVGEGVLDKTLKDYVSKRVGEDFGEVFEKALKESGSIPLHKFTTQLKEKLLPEKQVLEEQEEQREEKRKEERKEQEKQATEKQKREEEQKQEQELDLSAPVEETEEWFGGKVIPFPKPPSPGMSA